MFFYNMAVFFKVSSLLCFIVLLTMCKGFGTIHILLEKIKSNYSLPGKGYEIL